MGCARCHTCRLLCRQHTGLHACHILYSVLKRATTTGRVRDIVHAFHSFRHIISLAPSAVNVNYFFRVFCTRLRGWVSPVPGRPLWFLRGRHAPARPALPRNALSLRTLSRANDNTARAPHYRQPFARFRQHSRRTLPPHGLAFLAAARTHLTTHCNRLVGASLPPAVAYYTIALLPTNDAARVRLLWRRTASTIPAADTTRNVSTRTVNYLAHRQAPAVRTGGWPYHTTADAPHLPGHFADSHSAWLELCGTVACRSGSTTATCLPPGDPAYQCVDVGYDGLPLMLRN